MSDKASKGYSFFDHTADVGMNARGDNLEELFVNSAKGLFELLVEESPLVPRKSREIGIEAKNPDELFRNWLKELLFWFNSDGFLAADYEFDTISNTNLNGRIVGECFDPLRHSQGIEVKGVTYHQLKVEHTPDGYSASVIFDV